MSLRKLYKSSVFYPSLILLAVATVYALVNCYFSEGERIGYLTEWYEIVILHILYAILYSIIIATLSLTIFLNKLERVRLNPTLSRLSWFLLPFGFIFLTIGKAINETVTVNSIWEIIYATVAGVPFIVSFILTYREFRMLSE